MRCTTAGNIRTDIFNNYDDCAAIEAGDLLVSYTSQVPVADEACAALRRFLERGGRWFAIHASNSVRDNTYLPGILGSRFITHPPYTHYRVEITAPDDPLLDGINTPFEVDDELYVIEQADDDIEVLLHTRWGGEAMGRTFEEAFRPLMYRRKVGDGGVLYLALGHCNRPFDKPAPTHPTARSARPLGAARVPGADPPRRGLGCSPTALVSQTLAVASGELVHSARGRLVHILSACSCGGHRPAGGPVALSTASAAFADSGFGARVPGQHVYDRATVLPANQLELLEKRAAALDALGAPDGRVRARPGCQPGAGPAGSSPADGRLGRRVGPERA